MSRIIAFSTTVSFRYLFLEIKSIYFFVCFEFPPTRVAMESKNQIWWLISNEKITAILHVMQLSNVTSVFTKSKILNQFYLLYNSLPMNYDFTIDIEQWIRVIVLMI